MNPKMFNLLTGFIVARHGVYVNRQLGKPKPWTNDLILRQYRFCNVYRELDKVTKWIARNWRTPNQDDPHLWFAMLVARYINEPDTLKELGYPVPWNLKLWLRAVEYRKSIGQNVFNAAYIIPPTAGSRTGGTTVGGPKHEALGRFFTYFWEHRNEMKPAKDQALADYADKLCTVPGMGRFFAGQIIADLKYVPILKKSPDWWTFAVSGPGSRRGLNRVLGRPVNQTWKEIEWFGELTSLRGAVSTVIKNVAAMDAIHAQDMQNCLCEFDKYMRVKLGEGRPKQKYPGER